MFFSYLLFNEMERIENTFDKKSDSIDNYGYSLLYGKWAVISSIGINNPKIKEKSKEIYEQARTLIEQRLSKWKKFDEFIKKKRSNTKYFKDEPNYELYYKVNIIDEDIREYFLK